MVSIYSLRLVYTFLYTKINGNVAASFVQKKKGFKILWPKKFYLYLIVHIWLDPSPPLLCVCTLWMTSRKVFQYCSVFTPNDS